MAGFYFILHLVVFNGFILYGLALSSSPAAIKSAPGTQWIHAASQKQTEFPSKRDSEIIVVGLGQRSGKAEAGRLELGGETGKGNPGDDYSDLDAEQVSSGEGETRRTELEKVNKDWGSFERAHIETESRNFGRDQRFDRDAWRNNIDKYFMKRSKDGSQGKRTSDNRKPNTGKKPTWDTNTMNTWGKRRVYWDAVPNSDNYSDKENNASKGKREWTPDNLPECKEKETVTWLPTGMATRIKRRML